MQLDFDEFLPKVMPFVMGCPEPVAVRAMREAARDFCERTLLWRDEDTLLAAAQAEELILACAQEADIVRIERVDFQGQPLEPTSWRELDMLEPAWRYGASGVPRYFTQVAPDTLRLVPHAAGTVRCWVVLKPSTRAQGLPAVLAKYDQALAAGTLARLLMMEGKPWFSPSQAAVRSSEYEAGVADAKRLSTSGQQRARQRTRPQFF